MTIESRLNRVERMLGEVRTTRVVYSHAQLVHMAHGGDPGPHELVIGIDEKSPAELVIDTMRRFHERQAGAKPEDAAAPSFR